MSKHLFVYSLLSKLTNFSVPVHIQTQILLLTNWTLINMAQTRQAKYLVALETILRLFPWKLQTDPTIILVIITILSVYNFRANQFCNFFFIFLNNFIWLIIDKFILIEIYFIVLIFVKIIIMSWQLIWIWKWLLEFEVLSIVPFKDLQVIKPFFNHLISSISCFETKSCRTILQAQFFTSFAFF